MALSRQVFNLLRTRCVQPLFVNKPTESRSIHRWVAPTLKEIQRRKDKLGEQKPSPRSSYLEWNYDSEVYAFGKRLGEEFETNILKTALTHKSYINIQEMKSDEIGSTLPLNLNANTDLIKRGDEILTTSVRNLLQNKYPEPVVKSMSDYLINEKMLAHVGSHIGLTDIILTSEFPVEQVTVAQTFKAVVAALEESVDLKRAELFINDFLVSQLNGKDVFDIWEPKEPYEYLTNLLNGKDMEPRLCSQSATNTILANFQVGIYSDKKLLGIGWGESVDIAKQTAALNAIQKIYNLK